jgi:hypothetical protein
MSCYGFIEQECECENDFTLPILPFNVEPGETLDHGHEDGLVHPFCENLKPNLAILLFSC